jgi:hypothetical protein
MSYAGSYSSRGQYKGVSIVESPTDEDPRSGYAGRARIKDVESKLGQFLPQHHSNFIRTY